MFKNPFSFDGRIRRLEFGLSQIIVFSVFLTSFLLAVAIGRAGGGFISFFLIIAGLWFRLAQGAKRCHDLGDSGWYQLIPFYGFLLLFKDGEPRRNDWGFNPKTEADDVSSRFGASDTMDGHMMR